MTRGDALLIAGYVLAVPPLLKVRDLLRSRNALVYFGVMEVGQLLVLAGWGLKRKPLPMAVNAAAAVGWPVLWARRAGRG